MKKGILFMLAVLILSACQESLEDKCARECVEFTKRKCPSPVAQDMIIDSMTFEAATRTIHYYYTLTGVADSVGLFSHEEVHQALRDQVRNTTMMRAYKEEGFNFTYTYHSQRRPELVLFEETLTKKDYQ